MRVKVSVLFFMFFLASVSGERGIWEKKRRNAMYFE